VPRTRLFLDSPWLSDALYQFKSYARECDRLRSLINEPGFVATFHLMGIGYASPLSVSVEVAA
jgi:hypothetical protein